MREIVAVITAFLRCRTGVQKRFSALPERGLAGTPDFAAQAKRSRCKWYTSAMRILMVGAGAVGGFLGARLVCVGENVTFAVRGERARVLCEQGLAIHGPQGDEHVALAHVAALEELTGPFDLILVAVKWPALETVADELARLLAPHGVVAPLLNGVDSEDVVARYVGAQRTIAAVAYMSAGSKGANELYAHGATRVGFAPYRPGQEANVEELARLFERAGIPARRFADARTMLWEKMIWNAPYNALCALTRKNAGTVTERMPELLRDAMREVLTVGRAEGAQLSDGLVEAMLTLTRDEFPATEPSMLQDVRAGRSTEVDILQQRVVRGGERHGIATPVMRTLSALVRGLA
jgi:2-dehydropantoate 2-reductase